MPNLRIYRRAWIVPAVVALLTLLLLHSPDVLPVSDQPTSFDGERAYTDARTLALRFPGRTAGSDADARSAVWLVERLRSLGLQPRIETFAATIEGRSVALQNIWALSPGKTQGAIVVLANRDSPPLDTQGANDNASGVAMALELARVFTVTAHVHPIVFLWTDGDAYGGVGSQAFVDRHPEMPITAAVALRRVGTAGLARIALDGWSTAPRAAPPWLWLLTSSSQRTVAGIWTPLPSPFTQVLRLAAPVGSGSQGPFVEAGAAAVSISGGGRRPPPQLDIVSTLSAKTLARVGTASQALVTGIDTATSPLAGSGTTVFFSRFRTMSGRLVVITLLAMMLPVAAVTLDLFAQARKRRTPARRAWRRFATSLAPWLVLLAVAYGANLAGLLPGGRGTPISPETLVAQNPRWLRVVALLVVAVLLFRLAAVSDRRYLRRSVVAREDVVLVAYVVLLAAALATFLVNPFSLLLALPAAILWPLARPGRWERSLLPVFAGLAGLVTVMVMYALQLHLGLAVWWYFFVLLANGTVPPLLALAGAGFLTATLTLGRALHAPVEAAAPPAEEPPLPAADGPVERLDEGVATITVTVKPKKGQS